MNNNYQNIITIIIKHKNMNRNPFKEFVNIYLNTDR